MSRMKSWIARAALVGVLGIVSPQISRASTGDAAVDALIAEYVARYAEDPANPNLPDALLRQSAAVLDLARELKPDEFRFARASADVLLRLGERDRAIDALTAIRKIEPADQVAMIQYVDLVTSKMETAEQKIAYLKQIVGAVGVATEVQSHASTKLMDLYYARAQDSEAKEALAMALNLNGQNIEALKAAYRIAAAGGNRRDRVKALSDLMRASPTDIDAMQTLAHEADAVGSYDNSEILRLLAFKIGGTRGVPPTVDETINFMGTQLLAGNDNSVAEMLSRLLEALKDDGRVYTLGLLYEQMHDRPEAAQRENVEMSRGVYLAQLAGVSQLLNEPEKTEMPATRPAVPMPNVRADVARLKANDPNKLTMAYAVALAEQLWFDIYFRAADVDDANIEALGQLLGESDPIVVRFQGWKLLQAGKYDEARIKLEAVADRDGFARLGMILADRAVGKVDQAREELLEMIRSRPTGMIAAYVTSLARSMEVVADQTAQERDIADIITSVRGYIIDLVNNPQGFYLLSGQPSKMSYATGEPILATVTILNNGRVPITVCPGGVIDPVFLIDAQVRASPPIGLPAATRGEFTGAVRLKPSQKITQTVRVDRASLYDLLHAYPAPLFAMFADVITNPVADGPRSFKAGAAGQISRLGRTFERKSSPVFLDEYMEKAITQLASGSPQERIGTAELFATLIPSLRNNPTADDGPAVEKVEQRVQAAQKMEDALKAQQENESVPELKEWMQAIYPRGVTADERAERVRRLARSQTVVGQLIGMIDARTEPREVRQAVAKTVLEAQPGGAVAEFARALADQPDLVAPATTEGQGE